MSKSKIEIIEFPIFSDYFIHVEITDDIAETLQKYKSLRDIDVEMLLDGDGCTIQRGDAGMSFIFLRPNPSVSTIAHESFHALMNLMNFIHADLEDEVMAYHLGYIVQRIHSFVHKSTRRK